MLKRFARTIEIEVSPESFVYRYEGRDRRVPTRGYIRKIKGQEPRYEFEEKPESSEFVAVSLFSLPPDLQKDIIDILAAFLIYGVQPFCRLVCPILILKGVERFETGFGFEYAAFNEAAKMIALGGKEVHLE